MWASWASVKPEVWRSLGRNRLEKSLTVAPRIVFGEMKKRGTSKGGASLGMARQEVLRPNRSSAGVSLCVRERRLLLKSLPLLSDCVHCLKSWIPRLRPGPALRGFPLPGASPCRGLYPCVPLCPLFIPPSVRWLLPLMFAN